MLPPRVQLISINEDSEGQRLDNFLFKTLKGVPKTHIHRIIRGGEVRVNKGRADSSTKLALGDTVRVPPVRTSGSADEKIAHPAPAKDFAILFEDEHFIALDKPAGTAVHGGSGVSFGVIEQLRSARPQARFLELIHRLDRETSGVLLIAKKRSALTGLQAQFKERVTKKTYFALVLGSYPENKKVLDAPLHKFLDAKQERRVKVVAKGDPDGMQAITLVKLKKVLMLDNFGPLSLLEVGIKTGRTHQIRVHLQHAGYVIAMDEKYGDFERNKQLSKLGLKRMFLHAWQLVLKHPATGEAICIEAPLSLELAQFLNTTT